MNTHTTVAGPQPKSRLDLPRDFRMPVAPRFVRGKVYRTLSTSESDAAGQAAQGSVPLAGVWLAGLALALSRYTGASCIPLGLVLPSSGSDDSEAALAHLEIEVASEATLDRVLQQAVQEALQPGHPDRAAGAKPQVTAAFVGLAVAPGAVALTREGLEDFEYALVESELNFRVSHSDSGETQLECEYDAEGYERDTVEGLLTSWQHLVGAFACSKNALAKRLPMWPEARLAEWLQCLCGPERDIPAVTVDDCVRAQALRTPDAVAVATQAERLSYRELMARAERVAAGLRRRGAQPGDRVIVAMERSADLVTTLLGVMGAGCAYVPVDPAYPVKRQVFVFSDAGARFVVGQSPLPLSSEDGVDAEAVKQWNAQRISPADLLAPDSRLPDAPATTQADSSSTAYLIYTSGSTGLPKGVRVGHRAAVNLLLAMAERSRLQVGQTWLAVTTLAFDISFAELFVPLCVGATTWVARTSDASDPAALAGLIESTACEVLQATPSTWRMLVASGWAGRPSLTAITGGEALDGHMADELRTRVGRLCNVYGPTESTVWVTWEDVEPGPGGISIGAPLRNVTLRVLDESGVPVPPGVPGELYIGGACLAEGYHDRAQLTGERFVSHSVAGEPAVRVYRTGDLVRASASGRIRWLARIDDQVKLRGFRIELGEVEAALAGMAGVRQAVAAVRRFGESDQRLVAYVAWNGEPPAGWVAAARSLVRRTLPEHMVPSAFVALDAVPLTDNGKVDRKALPLPASEPVRQAASSDAVLDRMLALWQEVLRIAEVSADENFFDLGGHSLLLVSLQAKVEQAFGLRVPRVEFFRNPTAAGLAAYVARNGQATVSSAGDAGLQRVTQRKATSQASDIAVVGIGLRFPGAASGQAFWRNLCEGVEARTEFSEQELLDAGVSAELLANPAYVRAGFVLDGIDQFDANFFGMTPREAELLDPQQRVFLECAWEALEDAGVDPATQGAGIGIYAGTDHSAYHANVLAARDESLGPAGAFQVRINNDKDYLPTRVSYRLNCKGPSVNVQTACSTSLVAVHLAAQSLMRGECDAALAGGVCIHVPQRAGYLYQDGMVASPDGHCRAFDRQGGGTVFGSGAGVVLLKRLDDALAAGDRIYAVVKGSAINNDGSDKIGFTAPSVDGQAAVIRQAQAMANVDARDIACVEAHGTATPLGDPIEVSALTQAFRASTGDSRFCALGSVKTNIGHLDQAAGIAGFIKATLSVHHGQIPPSLHFNEANPEIDFERTPFFVNTQLRPWPTNKRLAGVSSFGIGGTNAHVIVGEAPAVVSAEQEGPAGRGAEVLTLSARSEEALREMAGRYAAQLQAQPGLRLADVCFTANTGRSAFEQRAAWVVREQADLVRALDEFSRTGEAAGTARGVYRNRRPRVAMLFTGQGAQYAGMSRTLYEKEPVFNAALDECARLLQGWLDVDLIELLHGEDAEALNRTDRTQPALFALGYALRRLWSHWGIEPQWVLGHSLGEYIAAQAAGVFSLEDGLRLVARRGQLMQQHCEAGAMLSVALDEAALRERLRGSDLVIAALNAPGQQVVAGRPEAVERLKEALVRDGVRAERLAGSHAFHSPLMEPMLEAFRAELASVQLQPPRLPLLSNLSGELAGEEMASAGYWLRHTREAVRFGPSIETLQGQGVDLLLEVGPRPTLVALSRQVLGDAAPTSLASLRSGRDEVEQMLESLATLQVRGAAVNWAVFHQDTRPRKVALPTYPFQRKRYWVEDDGVEAARADAVSVPSEGLGRRLNVAGATTVFELRCGADSHPFLNEHRLDGRILAPGAFFVALALQAGAALDGSPSGVKDMVLAAPLFLADDERRVLQLAISPAREPGRFQFTLHSRPDDPVAAERWVMHASGELAPGSSGQPRAVLAAAETTREPVPGDELRRRFAQRGLQYSGDFCALQDLRRDRLSAIGRLSVPASRAAERAGLRLHPGVLDAALQATAACGAYAELDGAFVPLAFDAVEWTGKGPFEPRTVHVRLAEATTQVVRADLDLLDAEGQPVMRIAGMTLKRLDRGESPETASTAVAATVRGVEWVTSALDEPPADLAGAWLLVGDEGPCRELAARLVAQGTAVDCVVMPDAADAAAMRLTVQSHARPLRGVVRLLPAVPPTSEHLATACMQVVHLVRELAGAALAPTFRLWLVTRGATAPDALQGVDPGQAALAALGRTLAVEYPDLKLVNVDLPGGAWRDASALQLVRELASDAGETDIALHAERHVLRLEAPVEEAAAAALPRSARYRLAGTTDGRIDAIAFVPDEPRALAPREIEIRVVSTGLNFRDVLRVLGKVPGPAEAGLGGECSGIVTAVGPEVQGLRPGDRVMAMADGSFASHVQVDARHVQRMPDHWSFEAAATVPVAFLTAHYALSELGRLQRGQSVLIHAAATGVGLAAVQLARRMGLRVFATASSGKQALLHRLGITQVYDSRSLGFSDGVREATQGHGVDAVLNALTGDFIAASLRTLAPSGVFIEMGKAEVWTPEQVARHHPTAKYLPFDIAQVPADRIHVLFGELEAMFQAGELQPLPKTVHPLTDVRQVFRTMAQGRHVGKLVLRDPRAEAPLLAAGATYLVTGASGALGRRLAEWLVGQGARHLALVARKINAETDELLTRLAGQGATVHFLAADLAEGRDVQQVVAQVRAALPPLRGVFHAAGVLADAPASQLTRDSFVRVLGAKLDGGRALHELTLDQGLDHFVAYSSVASVMGSPGQANYAAANGALDGLMRQRRGLGLPGLAIHWGAWGGAGMADALDAATWQRWARQGQFPMAPEQGMARLGELLVSPRPQAIVAALDWKRLADTRRPVPSLLGGLADVRPGVPVPQASAPQNVPALVEAAVRKVTAARASTRLDPHASLRDLGLDSLMAMELRNELCAATGLRLSATLAFDHPSIDAIARHLAALQAPPPVAGAMPTAPIAPPSGEEAGDDLLARLSAEISKIEGFLS